MARPVGSKNRPGSKKSGSPAGTPKPIIEKTCAKCGGNFLGYNGNKYCSRACHLLSNTRAEGDCLIWTGTKRGGYGEVDFGKPRVRMLAHRASYEAFIGPIGDKCVCHSCDTPTCINPKHLWLGTLQENTADRQAKGRQARGERNAPAKLTTEQVKAILADARGCRRAAKAYGVHMSTIMSIRRGDTWKHVK
jgi:hypothetical protein